MAMLYSAPIMTHSVSRPRKFDPFRLLLENMTEYAICTLDPNGLILTWNAGALQLKGYTGEEAIGNHFSAFFTLEDSERDTHLNVLSQAICDGMVEDHGWLVRKDSSRFWAKRIVKTLRDESGIVRGFGVITKQITERRSVDDVQLLERRMREEIAECVEERTSELSRVISQLEKANRIKDEFLAMVSHELRTPLGSVVGWVKLIRMGRMPEDQVVHALEIIDRNLSAQKDLIEDLLSVSRIVSGKLTINPEPLNPALIINDTIESFRPLLDGKQQRIDVALETDIVIQVDPVRFQQIFWNLLSNAMKFTPSGGSIRVLLRRGEGQASLSVSDTGAGIASEFLPYVFDRFRQAGSSPSRRYAGLGLGLSIVRHLVESHGGTVSVTSEGPGKGSTFSVHLPFPKASARPLRNQRAVELSFAH
jgi:PAS domain S-box-containing protein